ncbi:MAG: hypothetical protein ABSG64_10770 [Solirubrobacteraceae bacterium]
MSNPTVDAIMTPWNTRQQRSRTHAGLLRCCILLCCTAALLAAPLAFAASSDSNDTLAIPGPTAVAVNSQFSLALIGVTYDAGTTDIDVFAVPGDGTCDATLAQAGSDYAADARAVADVSGPGSFNTSANMTLASAGAYTLCGYINGSAQDAGSASSPITAVAPGILTITPPAAPVAPSEAVFGLTGSVTGSAAGPITITVYAVPEASSCQTSGLIAASEYEADYSGTAAVLVDGPFATTTTIDLAATGNYLLCGYLGGSYAGALEATATMDVAPLPCNDYNFTLTTPADVLGGRRALAVVSGGPVAFTASFTATATATASSGATGPSVQLAYNPYNDPDEVSQAGVPVPAVSGSATVTVQWTVVYAGTVCTGTASSSPITVLSQGVRPGVQINVDSHDAMAWVEFTGNCQVLTPTSATVTFSGAGVMRRYYIADVCGHWTSVRGPAPDVFFTSRKASIQAPATLEFHMEGNPATRNTYTLTVKCAGETHVNTVVATNGVHHRGALPFTFPQSLTVTPDR